jgi:hypothetical protein
MSTIKTIRDAVTAAKIHIETMKNNQVPQGIKATLENMKANAPDATTYSQCLCLVGYGVTIISGIAAVGLGGRALINIYQSQSFAYTVNALFCLLFGVLTNDLYHSTRVINLAGKVFNNVVDEYKKRDASEKQPISFKLTDVEAYKFDKALTEIEKHSKMLYLPYNIMTLRVDDYFEPAEAPRADGTKAQPKVDDNR